MTKEIHDDKHNQRIVPIRKITFWYFISTSKFPEDNGESSIRSSKSSHLH
uniref:Uncharacterized protein n=1 Tax=Amphimedon queenslandica TaxID=400682 RepID=A0A1X7SDD9_AMPQE